MNTNRYRLLLIEDENTIRNFVKTILETNEYQVLTAVNCQQGVMMFTSHMPDLVILDLGLPDKDGLRGTLVLKSTIAADEGLNLASVVVREVAIIGSRCGLFAPAMRLFENKKIDVKPLISHILPFEKALDAFELNKKKEVIKVLVKF